MPKPWPAVVSIDELERDGEPNPAAGEFRAALKRWDLTTTVPGPELLTRFAATEWPARLRAAKQLLRDVEYVSPWPGAEGLPVLRGRIDFLWKESDGWHLLTLDAGEGRKPAARFLEAWAAREQFGEPLRSATLLDVQTSRTSVIDLDSRPTAWKELAEQLAKRYPAVD